MPVYEEISHTPLFVHDPRVAADGERRSQLTQTIDIAPTILEFFGQEIPKDMQGKPLRRVIEKQEKIHDYVLFGFHEGHCNLTDGNYVYMKAPVDEAEFYEYTLMPTHMQRRFGTDELQDIELKEPFSFTKGCKTMKIRAKEGMNHLANFGTKLYCLADDPAQERPLHDVEKETELANEMLRWMHKDDCPSERFARFGFPVEGEVTQEDILRLHRMETVDRIPENFRNLSWEQGSVNMYYTVRRFLPQEAMVSAEAVLKDLVGSGTVTINHMCQWIQKIIPADYQPIALYFGMLASRTE